MRGLVPYAWRSLAARPARSLLTAFGIAIGVAVLVAALAVDAGLDASVQRTVDATIGRADLRVAAFTEAGLSARTLDAVDAVPGRRGRRARDRAAGVPRGPERPAGVGRRARHRPRHRSCRWKRRVRDLATVSGSGAADPAVRVRRS